MNKIFNRNKFFCGNLLAGLLATVFMVTPSFAVTDPVAELNGIATHLISKLKENQVNIKSNPQLVYRLAEDIVVPHADIHEMSQRVLPPQIWNSATPSQRHRFENAFTGLLVRTYASALANYNDQVVRFYPVRGGYQGKSRVEVDSLIERPEGAPISVHYFMILRGSEWKLYDLNVEGVSMLESFRSQFADQLSHGNMETLLQHLSAHNNGR